MKTYQVTLPIAGHCVVEVEADDYDSAIDKAFDVVELANITDWEAIRQFTQGNVCYCPRPWEAEACIALGDDAEQEVLST